jgi:RNA polymerase sigma-70 factor (ECF subfamily)
MAFSEIAPGVITRAKNGDEDAFHLIFNRYGRPVLSFINNLVQNHELAEELAQETFVRAYRNLRGLQDEARLSTWLFGIARNAALDELRRRSRHASLEADPADPAAAAPDDAVEAAFNRAAVRAALLTLDARNREVVALKFHAGLDNAEIAAVLGVSPSNAGTLLHRAMTKLREAIEAD